jgi:putative cardiolipin synthase
MLGRFIMRMPLVKSFFLLSSFAIFTANPASSADYVAPPSQCSTLSYLIKMTGNQPDLSLEAGPNTLNTRVTDAFREEFAKTDPTLEPISRMHLIPHNSLVKPLIDPEEAAVALIMAIRRAKHEVVIGTYIFGKDEFSHAILNEVKDALGRGVDVRVLVDSEGTPGLHHDLLKVLHSVPRGYAVDDFGNLTTRLATVQTSIFNPPSRVLQALPKFLSSLHNLHDTAEGIREAEKMFSRRMHTKIAGVDMDYPEGVAFLGGRNKDGAYYGFPEKGPRTYNDAEIMIRNDLSDYKPGQKTLSNTLAREFRKLYGHLTNREIFEVMGGAESSTYKKITGRMADESAKMWKPGGEYEKVLKRLQTENFLDTGFDRSETRLLSEIENVNRKSAWNKPDEIGDGNWMSITKNIDHYSKHADKGITIVTPYPNMTPAERAFLIDKMIKDPNYTFTLVTNSLYSGDNIITQYVVDNKLIPALKAEAKAAAIKSGMNEADADLFVGRFKIYALGKLDGVQFGGDQFYGKLHAKFAQFFSKDASQTKTVVGSYNGDNISRFHNSEVAVTTPGEGQTHAAYIQYTQDLINKSYEWGSPNWLTLRNSKQLRKKRLIESVVKRVERFVDPIE